MNAQPSSFTFNLKPEDVPVLRKIAKRHDFEFSDLPYGHFRASKKKITLQAYLSGKLLVQGKEAKEFIEFVLELELFKEARLGYEEVLQSEMFAPHIGVDESGKGDFFGHLVIAGVYVEKETARKLLDIGVKDSKKITSDTKAIELAQKIRAILGNHFKVISISPLRYNELYLSFKNLNKLLAWGHASVIEELLERVPDCPMALSDQFAKDKGVILRALKERGKKIKMKQKTKAESDVAVAAASILARAEFVQSLKKLGEEVKADLPKGAGMVLPVARDIFKREGEEELARISKKHFKTFREALAPSLFEK